ncbi:MULTISPECIES: FtsL-like putative cell division protein [unclassified Candidatus Cardinium]|uniref:FtsL-like putative cell division protein n=1 Tax=unclassified Candidatus Cardinium TaxID=2641185 RepID=UPI001FB42EDD|nr:MULTISPECIES: FtsL-like putative cell division protein [unclassified Candidatus Cardinium]
MIENTYKPIKKSNLFNRLEKKFRLYGIALDIPYYLPRLLYIFSLGLVYIWNAHYHEKMLHQINELQPMVDGLRVKHMRLQSSYMFERKQSEVAKKVAQLAIYESKVPPYLIAASRRATLASPRNILSYFLLDQKPRKKSNVS